MSSLDAIYASYAGSTGQQAAILRDDLLKAVWSTSRRLTRSEDAAQDITLRIHNQLDSFKPRGSSPMKSWVSTVSRYVSMQHRTKAARHPVYPLPTTEAPAEEDSFQSYGNLADLADPWLLDIALKLSWGLSISDLAAELDIAPKSLTKRIYRSIQAMYRTA